MEIEICTMEQLREAAEFAYARNVIEEFRCRPFLVTESLEQIVASYRKYIKKDYHDVLLQYDNDTLVGVTGFYWIDEDNYLSISRGIFAEGDYSKISNRFVEYF